jgi:Beta-lactamase
VTAFAGLDAFAASVLEVGTTPALAVAITDRERTLTARTYGAASPDALWPIASIGKSFTAVVALGEGALAIASGREPPAPELAPAEPLADDRTCPAEWTPQGTPYYRAFIS